MRRSLIIFSGVVAFLFYRCISEKKDIDHSYFDGKWEAEWLFTDSEMRDMFMESALSMQGEVIFDQQQLVEITAYGFEGCIFAVDTATNTMRYEFQDSVLNLINSEDEVVFSYRIKEQLPDRLTLLLMDDIQLTLHR